MTFSLTGSTDTIAHTTNGVGDPVTSTLHIILGKFILPC